MLYDVIDIDLEPCPFCGEKVKMIYTLPMMWIQCDNCGIYMRQEYDMPNRFHARDKLAERWNRRAKND